jgi:hypothetical protein
MTFTNLSGTDEISAVRILLLNEHLQLYVFISYAFLKNAA